MGLYSGGHPRHHPLGNGGALLFARPIGASSFYADLLGYLSPPAEDQQGEKPFLSGEVRFNLNFKRLSGRPYEGGRWKREPVECSRVNSFTNEPTCNDNSSGFCMLDLWI